MATPDFTSFTKEVLLSILHALGVDFPSADLPVDQLAQIVADSEAAVGEKVFTEAIAKAQGLSVQPPKPTTSPAKEQRLSFAVVSDDGSHKLVQTWVADRNLDSGIGDIEIISDTFDPLSSNYSVNC